MIETNGILVETEEIRRCLLSVTQVNHYQRRVAELRIAMSDLELAGTDEKINVNIAIFHLLKGKIATFEEILEDHANAAGQLAAHQQPNQT